MGITFDGREEALLFFKWLYWQRGIPAKQFKQERLKDVLDINEINNAIQKKELTNQEMEKMINSM